MPRERDDDRYESKNVTDWDQSMLSGGQINKVEVTDTETGETNTGVSLNSEDAAIDDAMSKFDDDD